MTRVFAWLSMFLLLAAWSLGASDVPRQDTSPVLIELFTSEGCSSCPPADALLQQLDQPGKVPGVQLIVLSEHVDYWNHDGWKDPYSSSFFSERQVAYATRFKLNSAYTPQMVVDGTTEFVGGSESSVKQAVEKSHAAAKVPVGISTISLDDRGILHARVETGALPDSGTNRKADVVFVVALNHAESQVMHGENQGRHLTHVAVVQSLTRVGAAEKGKGFTEDVHIKLSPGTDRSNLRVIAFLQVPGSGPVLGAALRQVGK